MSNYSGHDAQSLVDARALKVLVLSPWGLTGGYSGPIVLLSRLFSAVAKNSHVSIDVAYRERGIDQKPEWINQAFPLVISSLHEFTFRQKIMWILAVRALVRRQGKKYDVIHLHGAYMLNLLPFLGLKCRSKIAVLPVLDGGDLTTARGALARRIKDAVFQHVLKPALIGLSLAPGITSDLETHGVIRGRIHEIPNAVDVDEFRPRTSAPCNGAAFVLGFVGKMGWTKQPHLILEAVYQLRREGYSFRALFVGPFEDSKYENFFETLVEDYALSDYIDVLGFQADVSSIVREMDAFVLPSKAEGMPGALVEAMATGLPVLVTDVGAMRNVVEESSAGFIIEGAAESIASVARTLIEDPDLRDSKGRAAREYASSNFSSDAVSHIYLKAINKSTVGCGNRMDGELSQMPGLAGLERLLSKWRGSTAYVVPLTDEFGKALGNNGDELMHTVFYKILAEFEIRVTNDSTSADLVVVPPNGALLEVYNFPQILQRRLIGFEDKPLVIFPSSAFFPATDPSVIFSGRSVETLWILREHNSYSHLLEKWGQVLTDKGVKLALDHDVVASGHKFVPGIVGGHSNSRPLIAARLDRESRSVSSSEPSTAAESRRRVLQKKLAAMLPYGKFYTRLARLAKRTELDAAGRNLVSGFDLGTWAKENIRRAAIVDISSREYATFDEYLSLLGHASVVVTDRLHVGLPAAVLGKEVILVEAGYHKLGGVYEQSLKEMPNVSFRRRT